VQSLLLRLHIDQNGAGRDHIHRAGRKGGQVVSRGAHEPAAIKRLHLLGKGATVL
jgi:hypothetical protein